MKAWKVILIVVAAAAAMAAVGIWAVQRGRLGAILAALAVAAVLAYLCWGLFTEKERSPVGRFLDLNETDARELGSSLLTGLVVAVLVMLLQIYLDVAREKDEREQQLRLSIGVSQSLAGLDAHDSDLSEISLAGKDLDRADLSGADLSDTNLEDTSLREADLRGANLEGASLYRAKLPRARLSGADLDRADLRFANLGDAQIYGEGEDGRASFEGALVNARTCLPADILTGKGDPNPEIRRELEPRETEIHGRTRAAPGLGYQCPLTADNVIDDLQQYNRGRTYAELAEPWRVEASQVAAVFEANPATHLKRLSLRLTRPPCPGDDRVHVISTQWPKGYFVLLIRGRPTPPGKTLAIPIENEDGELRSPVVLPRRLKRGTEVVLFAIPSSTEEGLGSKFINPTRIRRCARRRQPAREVAG